MRKLLCFSLVAAVVLLSACGDAAGSQDISASSPAVTTEPEVIGPEPQNQEAELPELATESTQADSGGNTEPTASLWPTFHGRKTQCWKAMWTP